MTITHAPGYELAALQWLYDDLATALHRYGIPLHAEFVAVIRAIRAVRRKERAV